MAFIKTTLKQPTEVFSPSDVEGFRVDFTRTVCTVHTRRFDSVRRLYRSSNVRCKRSTVLFDNRKLIKKNLSEDTPGGNRTPDLLGVNQSS
jgi:hypothetical protein